MSSEHNTSNPPPALDWKLEIEKHWRACSERGIAFYQAHRQLFSGSRLLALLASSLLLTWLVSGVYRVGEGSRGVVSRLGAYHATTLPGLHWHLPSPLETVNTVNVEQQRFIEVGYSDGNGLNKTTPASAENLLLTGDENLIGLRLAVHYQITNPSDYLFQLKNSEMTLRQLSESILRAEIARYSMEYVLTDGQFQLTSAIKLGIQQALDRYQAGIVITSVNLQNGQLPEDVQTAFDNVIRAGEEKQRLISEAVNYQNETLAKARGAAARINEEAQAYAAEKVAKAQGETERFEKLLIEFEKNPGITRNRLFIEAKEKLFASTRKILVTSDSVPPLALAVPANPTVTETSTAQQHFSPEQASVESLVSDKPQAYKANRNLRPSRSRP